MIVWASRGFVVLVGVWLVGLGVFMLARPRLALAALARLRPLSWLGCRLRA